MTTNINAETGEYTLNEGRSPRFTSWVFLVICSIITLKSSAEVKNDMVEANSAAKWAVACSAITFAVAALVVVAHLNAVSSTMIVGSMVEGALTFVLVIVWIATVAIVTNTDNDLGVVKSDTNQVSNGNLYYFSWAGFVISVILFVSYLRSAMGLDLVGAMKERGQRLTHWGGLLAATLVVMGSSIRVFTEDCANANEADNFDDKYCKRTNLAIALGTIGFVVSAVVVGVKLICLVTPFVMEFSVSTCLAIMNAFGVGFITSNSGPGRAIGNLYYFSWISFIVSAMIVVECFNSSNSANAQVEASNTQESNDSPTKPEVPVEPLDDTEQGYD